MRVIAEIGSNVKCLKDCLQSVSAAKVAGADVVKFQYFTGADLYGPRYAGDRKLVIDIPAIANCARENEIEFMCTGFSPSVYKMIDPFVRRHKIASSELTAVDILETVNSFGKPVILSTGGASHEQIASSLLVLRNVPVTLLYCVVEYPARVVDLRQMVLLRQRFGDVCHVGYSDHSTDVLQIPHDAKKRGAVIIEKHVNFCGYTDTPDAGHSLTGHEFSLMCRHLKNRLSVAETRTKNPYQRIRTDDGWFRPMPAA